MENENPPIQWPRQFSHQVRLRISLMTDADSQIRELEGLMSKRTLPHQAVEWLLRQSLQFASTKASTSTQTTHTASSSFLRDEAKALIAERSFDFRGRAPEQWLNSYRLTDLRRGNNWRGMVSPFPFALSGRLFGTAARGLSKVGALSVGINLVDAAIKHDPDKAVGVLGTTAATSLVMGGVAKLAGARAVPIVGEVVGGVFAGKDAYDAAKSGHKARATASGIEATLYAISAAATTATVLDCWNPTVIAPATVAAIAGGAAVVMTTARTLRDNWSTISSWFDKWSNDFAAIHTRPTLSVSSGMRPGQLAIA